MYKKELIEINDKAQCFLMNELGFDSLNRMELYLGSLPPNKAYWELDRSGVYEYIFDLTKNETDLYGVKLHYNGVWATPIVVEATW